MADLVVGITTIDPQQADVLADQLVSEHLAACVQHVPGMKSTYLWKGEVHHDQEALLLIKTSEGRVQELKDWLERHHPYEAPELVFLPVSDGLTDYLRWIEDVVTS